LQPFAEASFDRKARGNVRCALKNVAIGAIGAQQRGQRHQVRSEPVVHVELDLLVEQKIAKFLPRQLLPNKLNACCFALKVPVGAVTGDCDAEREPMPQIGIPILYVAHATRADKPTQLRASAQPNAVGHAEPALFLGLGAAR
jgi:hypothetical protein